MHRAFTPVKNNAEKHSFDNPFIRSSFRGTRRQPSDELLLCHQEHEDRRGQHHHRERIQRAGGVLHIGQEPR